MVLIISHLGRDVKLCKAALRPGREYATIIRKHWRQRPEAPVTAAIFYRKRSRFNMSKNKEGRNKSMPSIRKNYTYNLIYQIMTLLTPFITTPYLSRVLGPDGTGIQSYTNSVVQYFAIAAALGTASYGQREIARSRDDKEALGRLFWEIELLCAGTTALCLICWMGVIGFSKEYAPYYGALSMTLIAVAFDISWFFGGLEQYGLIVVRNMAVKCVGIAMLFLFIRTKKRPPFICIPYGCHRTIGKYFHVGISKAVCGETGHQPAPPFQASEGDVCVFHPYHCHIRLYDS